MGKTQKEINDNIKDLENQIDDIRDYRKQRPDIAKLEEELSVLKNEYRKEISYSLKVLESDIEALKNELKRKKAEKEIYLSEKIQKWLRNYLSGVSFGYREPKIVWISKDERFSIITDPGGTAGTGTAMGTGGYYYAGTEHWLVETIEGGTYLGGPKLMEHKGRLTKEVKEKMIEYTKTLI